MAAEGKIYQHMKLCKHVVSPNVEPEIGMPGDYFIFTADLAMTAYPWRVANYACIE